ncbi:MULTISPECIES: helix-turn-helix domain-containing protein [Sphingobacterium]|uniref:helix-turn-helix domain-containing protein n=1 Tax=Sphingobacterium TaxID=28453 RepID=UPI000EE23E5D|nr:MULTISPECIES: helix-turn-helix domain-containing protein [Sphingobacterium]HAK29362.1 hypothetical protein [Sphingobacterium sp.]
MEQKFYSTKEASRMLNIERTTLYAWRNKGKIKMEKFDSQYYISADEIKPILEERIKTGKTQISTDFPAVSHQPILIEMPRRKYDSETR